LPVWFAFTGAFVALTWWCWSLAANQIALTRASGLDAIAADGEGARRAQVYAGLGAHGALYAHSSTAVTEARGLQRDVAADNTIAGFVYRIRLRTVTRLEQFYGRPPVEDWE
jgi:hypothetical protein